MEVVSAVHSFLPLLVRSSSSFEVLQGMLDRGLLEAVYDVTIAYPDTRPDTELDIIRGGLPGQVRGSNTLTLV